MARRVPDVNKVRALTSWQARKALVDILDHVIMEVRAKREPLALAGDE